MTGTRAATVDLLYLREDFHRQLCSEAFSIRAERSVRGKPTPVYINADKHSEVSVDLGARMAARLPAPGAPPTMKGWQLGNAFERAVLSFLAPALDLFPAFTSKQMRVEPGRVISNFAQFAHLAEIQAVIKENPELEATLGGDYLVDPDLVVNWSPRWSPTRSVSRRSRSERVTSTASTTGPSTSCAKAQPKRPRSSPVGRVPRGGWR